MFLSVDQSKCGAPAATKDDPFGHTEVVTKLLEIRDKVPGGVILQESES